MAGEKPYPRTTDRAEIARRASAPALELLALWDLKRGPRALPARRDLTPVELGRWLSRLTLVDVAHAPRRLTYRVVCSRHVDIRGYDPTGKTVEEGFHGRSLEAALENYRLAIDLRVPVYDWDDAPSRDGWLREQEMLMLPLGDDGSRVDKVLIYGDVVAVNAPTVHR
jgi:hypothetical protein